MAGPNRTSTRKPRGGAAPYRKGAAYEREGAEVLRGLGFLVTRQPKSQSPYDLIALQKPKRNNGFHFPRPWLVQAKLGGRIRPAEKEELVLLAEEYGAIPVLQRRRPIEFINLETMEVLV